MLVTNEDIQISVQEQKSGVRTRAHLGTCQKQYCIRTVLNISFDARRSPPGIIGTTCKPMSSIPTWGLLASVACAGGLFIGCNVQSNGKWCVAYASYDYECMVP